MNLKNRLIFTLYTIHGILLKGEPPSPPTRWDGKCADVRSARADGRTFQDGGPVGSAHRGRDISPSCLVVFPKCASERARVISPVYLRMLLKEVSPAATPIIQHVQSACSDVIMADALEANANRHTSQANPPNPRLRLAAHLREGFYAQICGCRLKLSAIIFAQD